ncbi:MAG: hypothetical protein OXG13_06485 [Gemmatimonadaceae bacterium]|nr:hypothetical protein [Gemmatimonadaceae bacterium]
MLSPRVQFDPSVPRFTWDEETFAKGLDTESRARADAAHGEPPADAGNCRFLMDVGTATRQVASAARTELEKHRSMVNDSLRLPDADADFLREQDEALADMHQICLSGIDSAEPPKTRVNEVRNEYTSFAVENGLVGRAAQARDTQAKWVIAAVAFLELLLNAWTLGTAHPSGFLGVLPEMVLFTAFNVFAGLVLSFALRTKNLHESFRSKRRFSWSLVALLVLLIPLFNFVFGHYRDALVSLQSQIAAGDYETYVTVWASLFRTALATAFSTEWIPQSMQTVVLIFGGMFMSSLVAYKHYHADDPYPGFGALSRKRDEAQGQYKAEIAAISSRIESRAADASRAFASIEARVASEGAAEARNRIESWNSAYRGLVQELKEAGDRQLRLYRRTNGAVKPWPASLNDPFEAFAVDPEVADPPAPPEMPVLKGAVSRLRRDCDRAVLEGRRRYSSEVFAPLPALDPKDVNHRAFADPLGRLEGIRRDLDGLPPATATEG